MIIHVPFGFNQISGFSELIFFPYGTMTDISFVVVVAILDFWSIKENTLFRSLYEEYFYRGIIPSQMQFQKKNFF